MELKAVSLAALLLLLSDLRPAGAGAAYTLHYFAARGKAEPIRLLLNELQLDYTEIRYTRPPVTGNMMNWEEEKPEGIASGLFPFGQLPVLTHIHRPVLLQQGKEGGVVSMAQSGAIMNYIGRQHSMYGKDIFQDMRIDEMIGGIGDLKAKWRDRFYGKETAEDLAAALLLWREEVPTWLSFIGTLKKKHGGRWMVGDELTLADFYAFEALDGAMRTDPATLADFPDLYAFVADFALRPNIRRYIQGSGDSKTKRLPHTGGLDKPGAEGPGAHYLGTIYARKTEL